MRCTNEGGREEDGYAACGLSGPFPNPSRYTAREPRGLDRVTARMGQWQETIRRWESMLPIFTEETRAVEAPKKLSRIVVKHAGDLG